MLPLVHLIPPLRSKLLPCSDLAFISEQLIADFFYKPRVDTIEWYQLLFSSHKADGFLTSNCLILSNMSWLA